MTRSVGHSADRASNNIVQKIMTTLEQLQGAFVDAENLCISFQLKRNKNEYTIRVLKDTGEPAAEIESRQSGHKINVFCRAEESMADLIHEIKVHLSAL